MNILRWTPKVFNSEIYLRCFRSRVTASFIHFSVLSWPFSCISIHMSVCYLLIFWWTCARNLRYGVHFSLRVASILLLLISFIGKEVALLLDFELSFGGSTCHNDTIIIVHCNQLWFEKWSVSYITSIKTCHYTYIIYHNPDKQVSLRVRLLKNYK